MGVFVWMGGSQALGTAEKCCGVCVCGGGGGGVALVALRAFGGIRVRCWDNFSRKWSNGGGGGGRGSRAFVLGVPKLGG